MSATKAHLSEKHMRKLEGRVTRDDLRGLSDPAGGHYLAVRMFRQVLSSLSLRFHVRVISLRSRPSGQLARFGDIGTDDPR
jgi:hypothetical protein